MGTRFQVGERMFFFPEGTLPPKSLLEMLTTTSMQVDLKDNSILLDDISAEDFQHVYAYLTKGIYPDFQHWQIFEYFGIAMFSDYDQLWKREEQMRNQMYADGHESNPMNTNPYYNLIPLTEEVWTWLQIGSADGPEILRYSSENTLQKRPWPAIQKDLQSLNKLLRENIFLAGGRIFSALFGTPSNDIDLFLHGLSEEQAHQKVRTWFQQMDLPEARARYHALQRFEYAPHTYDTLEQAYEEMDSLSVINRVMRTKNALSFRLNLLDVQFILRLYRTPSEILHGFDVDSCAIGYDGRQVWMTERFFYSLLAGYNTFSFDRLSPSYEWRLVKYGTRGMSIYVPGFDPAKIDQSAIVTRWEHHLDTTDRGTNAHQRYRYIKGNFLYSWRNAGERPPNLQGIDILVYMAFHCRQYNYNQRSLETVSRLSKETSDYDTVPFTHTAADQSFLRLINYLMDESSAENYPDHYNKYKHHFRPWVDSNVIKELHLNNIPTAPKIYFLMAHLMRSKNPLQTFDLLWELPEDLYLGFGVVRPWDLPRKAEFKTTNPGEQMTGTFHQTILDCPERWYEGQYYHT